MEFPKRKDSGKSLPDLSLFTPLCSLLDVTLNELLLGEVIPDECLYEVSGGQRQRCACDENRETIKNKPK